MKTPSFALLLTSLLLMSCGNRSVAQPVFSQTLQMRHAQQAQLQNQLQNQIQQQVKPRSTVVVRQAKAVAKPTVTSTPPSAPPPRKPQDIIPANPERTGEPLEIRLYRSYGHEQKLRIWGRVIHPKDEARANAEDSKWKNLWRNIKNLSVEEAPGVKVALDLNGHRFEVTSNDEGMLEVDVDTPPGFEPGQYTLRAALVSGQGVYAEPVETPFTLHPESDTSLGVVSDIDDTIVKSEVSEKIKAVGRLLLNNAFNSEPIPGTAELLRALENQDGKVDGDTFYLSGSPLNFSNRIYDYLDYQKYPQGPVYLKKWGFSENDDNPIQQSDYKLRRLREIMNFYPQKPFVFFGDSSEVDTEIYSQIAREFPGRVKAIFINNVNGQNPDESRFASVRLTTHAREAAEELVRLRLLKRSPF